MRILLIGAGIRRFGLDMFFAGLGVRVARQKAGPLRGWQQEGQLQGQRQKRRLVSWGAGDGRL